jgi:putative ABC transport system ATP-binding protein
MITRELISYIQAEKQRGQTDEAILRVLQSAGWTEELMRAGFQSLELSNGAAVLQARGLSKAYQNGAENTPVLKGVDLEIRRGESVAIVGKSGSGKSTLMHILATLDRPTAGDLLIDGTATADLDQGALDTLRNQKFGFVFQQFFVNARSTCLENVMLPLAIAGIPAAERISRGRQALALVGLSEKENARAGDLSGGQKQRLCIARALITEPEVIFADEPTGNLDTENGRRIVELLFDLQRTRGITLVIVTHDNDLAALCGRIITVKDGEIVTDTLHAH